MGSGTGNTAGSSAPFASPGAIGAGWRFAERRDQGMHAIAAPPAGWAARHAGGTREPLPDAGFRRCPGWGFGPLLGGRSTVGENPGAEWT